ncbi:Citrinin synthesis mpl6 [Hyphodiscus hymeniophilus]|uniref:Citrinin synthesis mpl6 n=1 Tax=Hyphodiscus hymeniophilus TaxID=353542 RepID=A0A9P6VDT7_9HELO|nr:Citrinin synthesis mpl6 [Hyphodiscus hymeniophilus]
MFAGFSFTSTTHHDTYPAIDSAKADLSGKYVFITGASKGVGRTTAISFARAGAEGIALGARSDCSNLEAELHSAAKEAGKKAPKVLAIKLDVLNKESVANAVKETEGAFGRLDILINNAGYLSGFAPIGDDDSDEWWMNWEVNIKGLYLVTKAFLPLLMKGGDKTIINLSSIGGLMIREGASGYQTTKFAVMRLTEFLMADHGKQGLLAYSIHPGGVLTELARKMPTQMHGDTPELAGDSMVSLVAQKREWLAGRYISVTWDLPELYSREQEIVKEDKLVMRMRF